MQSTEELSIQKIAVYYARGVDSLGNDKDPTKALEYLRRGFVEDCVFQYFWPDGTTFGSVTGLVAFIDFAYGFMKQKAYRNTQHMVSNYLILDADSTRARMESYVVARHIRQDKSQDIASAWYEDKIMRESDSWKCHQRKCVQLSFDNFAPAYSLY
jgi:hypothetical protein